MPNLPSEPISSLAGYAFLIEKFSLKLPELEMATAISTKNKKFYVSNYKKDSDKFHTTSVHELSHKADAQDRFSYYSSNSRIPEVNVDDLNKFGSNLSNDRFNYISDPSETEARKMSTLYFMNRSLGKDIKSGKIKESDINELYNMMNKSGGYNSDESTLPLDTRDLLELYKWQKDDLLKYLNNDFTYKPAKHKTGGTKKYFAGGLKNRVLYNNSKYKR